ncbi:hypothetical protein J6590_093948 [Homalodisca vitripennis]|nr:hypothetical protein J6590_024275 [Homalodisca vitripennis]KAG8255384.1 hypothetical protein J6590_093948 [Homalodisca vitripennis]
MWGWMRYKDHRAAKPHPLPSCPPNRNRCRALLRLAPWVDELLMQCKNGVIKTGGEKEWGQSRAEPSSTDKSRKFVDWSEPSSADQPCKYG